MFVPVAVTWAAGVKQLWQAEQARLLEAGFLFAGLATVGILAFDSTLTNASALPTLLYLPIPFFVWAALRFGPAVASTAFTLIAALVIWGAGHGQGPFLHAVAREDTLPIQVFLISVTVPVLFLAAVPHSQAATCNCRATTVPQPIAGGRYVTGTTVSVGKWLAYQPIARRVGISVPALPL